MTNDPFSPNPWIMGVVTVGAGMVLWWLTAHIERDEGPLARPAARLGAVMCVVMGIGILLAAARGT